MKDIKNILKKIKKANEFGKINDCIKLCREGISLTNPIQFEDWYGLRINLALFLTKFETDISSDNREEAISIYYEILDKLSIDKHPKKWASIHRNLGFVFYQRTEGDKENNLINTIKHYTKALTIFTKKEYPEDWAMIKAGIGSAYAEKKDRKDKENILKAIGNYFDALSIYTKSDFPADYKDSLQELSRLKKRLNDDETWNMIIEKFEGNSFGLD